MENSFSGLILKYVPEDEIRYLESVLGSIDAFNYFTDEVQVKSVINDLSYLDDFFTIIHNFNDKLDDAMFYEKFQVSESILQALKIFDDHYYKLKDASSIVRSDLGKFSLDEEFNLEEGKKYQYDLNAVTVITPSSTLSRFNDNSENGLEGSGHHDENVLEIIRAVYGDDARNMRETGQDIVIRYINRASKNTQEPFMMTVEIPSKINSSQKASLQNLNDEIKKFEARTGQRIVIHSSIIDYEDNRKIVDVVEYDENLDAILNKVMVSDSISLKYEELYSYDFEYPNAVNHYNDSYYRLTSTIIGPKEDDLGVYVFLASRYSNDIEIRQKRYSKMAGIITKKQAAFRYDTSDTHNEIIGRLEKEVFPKRNYDGFSKDYEDGILIFGTYNEIVIDLPKTITIEQYKYLEKIVEEVERFRKDYWYAQLLYYNGEDILKRAKAIITNKQDLDNDEVIVGVSIKKVDSEKTQEVVQSADESIDNIADFFYIFDTDQKVEEAELEYEDVNNSSVLLSEIEKINRAKHFSDETKEELISEIESSKRVR